MPRKLIDINQGEYFKGLVTPVLSGKKKFNTYIIIV